MIRYLIPLAIIFVIVSLTLFAVTPQPNTKVGVYNETPSQNITTGVLTLAAVPVAGSVRLFVNGIRQKPVEDFTIAGAAITPVPAAVSLYSNPSTILLVDYDK